MKKIIIIKHGGGELANQLWNFISIYAYSLERKYELQNPAFFENRKFFKMNGKHSSYNYTKRKTALKRRIGRKIYNWYANIISYFNKDRIIKTDIDAHYLPPTKVSDQELEKLESDNSDIYFDGWLFRNPIGIEKYRKEIHEYFRPRKDIEEVVESTISDLKNKYSKVVGVHIRQGDYKNWRGGGYFIEQSRVKEVINEYINIFNINKEKTCFLLTSDSPIDQSLFSDINIYVSKNNAVTDLFLLSSTDIIVGSNSTFGSFASYYGNIPLIVIQNSNMDWEYYKNRTGFFENKYSTFVKF